MQVNTISNAKTCQIGKVYIRKVIDGKKEHTYYIQGGTVSAEGVIKTRLRLGEREKSQRGGKSVPDRETKRVVCLSE